MIFWSLPQVHNCILLILNFSKNSWRVALSNSPFYFYAICNFLPPFFTFTIVRLFASWISLFRNLGQCSFTDQPSFRNLSGATTNHHPKLKHLMCSFALITHLLAYGGLLVLQIPHHMGFEYSESQLGHLGPTAIQIINKDDDNIIQKLRPGIELWENFDWSY